MSTPQEGKLLHAFGKRIAEVRKSKGITQNQLAERVNMSVVTIAYIETGKRWVRLSTLDKIARALKVPVAELFKGL
jgi:HTH-type transcriptional regulator, competence development regulator